MFVMFVELDLVAGLGVTLDAPDLRSRHAPEKTRASGARHTHRLDGNSSPVCGNPPCSSHRCCSQVPVYALDACFGLVNAKYVCQLLNPIPLIFNLFVAALAL